MVTTTTVNVLKREAILSNNVKIIGLHSGSLESSSLKIECVYPRYVFEYEEKEIENLPEILKQLEKRVK